MKVYLVYYETGKYEDHNVIHVAGFFSLENANNCVEERNRFLKEHKCFYSDDKTPSYSEREKIEELYEEKYNQPIYIDYTGGKFFIQEIEVQ